jgi:hypothetical protein
MELVALAAGVVSCARRLAENLTTLCRAMKTRRMLEKATEG